MSATHRPHLIALTGPTASGKSAIAVEAARRFDGEIINADSVQVYRGADIGSAKPSLEEMRGIPHHLISLFDPQEDFDAGRFRRDARAAVLEINARGKIPIVCGGTGLYLRALLNGIVDTPEITAEAHQALAALEAAGKDLHAALHERDPYTAESLSPADRARTRRALLVSLSSGTSLRRMKEAHGHREQEFSALVLCLLPARDELYRIIDARVDRMIESGLIDETRLLLERFPKTAKIFGALGYRHAAEFLSGAMSRGEMIDSLKRDTRRFAKRQYTWWRHQPDVLGWKRIESSGGPENGKTNKVKTGCETNITDSLFDAIMTFIARQEPFGAENVYFSAVAM